MNVISISTDRNILKEGSAVRARQIEYGNLFSQTHIILFSRKKIAGVLGSEYSYQISPNVWVYPTYSPSRLTYIRDAVRIGREIVKKHGCSPRDTVVTTQDPFETGLVGVRLKKSLGLPLHVQIHTDFLSPFFTRHSLVNRIRVHIARRVLPHAQGIRVVSQRIVDSMKARKMLLHATPVVLPVFVDIEKIEQTPIVTDLHKKYPQFSFIVLLAGRMTKEKNLGLGIEACAALIRAYPEKKIGAVIVGEGPEKEALRAQVRSLGIGQSVVWEPWTEDIFSYYKTADLFLSPSWYEGYGLALVEAALCRCPVVATDVGVARDIFDPAFLCKPGDKARFFELVAQIVEKIMTASSDVETYINQACVRARAIVLKDKKEYLDQYKNSIMQVSK